MSPRALAAAAVVSWAFYDLSFGALLIGFEGDPLTIGRVVAIGALYATGMVYYTIWMRRRNECQPRQPSR